MDRAAAEALIANYEALVEKAIAICNAPGPPWGFVSNEQFVRLTLEDETAVLTEPKADSYYDSCTVEVERVEIPAALLFMADSELAAWRAKARAEYEAEQARRKAEMFAAQDAKERAEFERLRQKFTSEAK